ncbi:MAG: hypothetical protein WD646_05430 [Actinomycetota bacterium]
MSHSRIFRVIAVACGTVLIGTAPAAGQVFDGPGEVPGQILPYTWNGPNGQAAFFGSAENWLVEGEVPDSPPGENDAVLFDLPAVQKKSAIVALSSPNAPDFEAIVGARIIREGEVVLRDGVMEVVGDGAVGDPSSIFGPMYFVGDEGLPAVVRHGGNVNLFGGKTIVGVDGGGGYEMDGGLSLGFGEHPDPWFVIREGASAKVGGDVKMDRGRLSVDGGGSFVRASNIFADGGVIHLVAPVGLPAESVVPCFIEAEKVELGGPALLRGSGEIGGGQFVNGGRVSPGSPGAVGTLGIEPHPEVGGGHYAQTSDGVLEIGLDPGHPKGLQSAASDRLEIAGHADLDGRLVLRATDQQFRPRPGTQFEVMLFGSRSGDVEVVDETGFKGLNFVKDYTETSLSLKAVAGGQGKPDRGNKVVIGSFHLPAVIEADDGMTYNFSGEAELRVRFVPQSDLIKVLVKFNDVVATDEGGALFRATNNLRHTFEDDGSGVNFGAGSVGFVSQEGGDAIPVESFILNFTKIKYEYFEQKDGTKTAGGIPMTWEITETESKA